MPPTPDTIVKVGKCARTGVEISICYNSFGDPKNPCVLLVMGMMSVGMLWRDELCERIAACGYYVIRYDNRDVGLSTHFSDFPGPHVARMILPRILSFGEKLPYTLEDMAADGMNLLTTLGINKAHVVGSSMGGMIVQLMAIHYPARVRSLSIIYSHTGNPNRVRESWRVKLGFLEKPASSALEDLVEFKCHLALRMAGDGYPIDRDKQREFMKKIIERAPDDPGSLRRHLSAVQRAESRVEGLRGLKTPTLVIHGMLDQLVPYENGIEIAKVIGRSAKLVLFPLMGHSIPEELFPAVAQEIVWNAQRADASE
ncbi:putative hydrolase, alpha/beta fold family [Trypanosoma cruzi]|uniref:Hydrolase, alpha/beta fold family, putative n=2 Tax=Trypanosoma cruzi TaxID=5693 RepID=Q4CQ95_TRYCC|nr:hydrolase, alpha/beta fold family, putative [Trypanosoma cruzi]EAN82447.1 hydrolase, alpha/beta fold family, putative [Trypanosoma cruzi]PWV16410.1 putative hydrolase, alpha/beta fold family [Trypanosoma cruzi]|eukprot:XP_804298.1 hydrolase, alpha/beta fold family [Trypanosoma cruzi strain CL Brener]